MPIITKPAMAKNGTNIISLDKSALALNSIVAAHPHFSSPNVWEKVLIKFKSTTLGQFEVVEFDATVAEPEGQFFVTETAEDIFEVEKITIVDPDGAILVIPRDELTAAEFDIDFGEVTPPGPVQSFIVWDTNLGTPGTTIAEADGGINGGSTNNIKSAANGLTNGEDYLITYKWDGLPAADMIHGVSSSLENSFSGMTAITYQQGSLIRYYNYNGVSEYSQRLSLSLVNASGENTIVIQKVGTVFTMKLNGNVIINESNHTNQVMYPYVRPWGVQALTLATIDSTPSSYLTYDQLGSGHTTDAFGGLATSSSSNAQSFRTTALSADFDVQFTFDGQVGGNDSIFGVKTSLDGNNNYFGFIFGGGFLSTYFDGYYKDGITQAPSNNVLRIKRTGSTIEFYANGVKTALNASNSNPMYIVARANVGFVLKSTINLLG